MLTTSLFAQRASTRIAELFPRESIAYSEFNVSRSIGWSFLREGVIDGNGDCHTCCAVCGGLRDGLWYQYVRVGDTGTEDNGWEDKQISYAVFCHECAHVADFGCHPDQWVTEVVDWNGRRLTTDSMVTDCPFFSPATPEELRAVLRYVHNCLRESLSSHDHAMSLYSDYNFLLCALNATQESIATS